ncbi:chorismate mutase [Paenibacillus sp. sgz302251]|uniref:chorismate mutase n=1 Tax=Paenibacillus sp. sgz302251 TaxID=3414493 RepID=UPI003C7DC5B6
MKAFRLNELRAGIDQLDDEIISLLAKRFALTEEVGLYKAINKLEAQDPKRESTQFHKIIQLSDTHGLKPDYATTIYRCLMDVVISRHEEIKQSYDGQNLIGQIEAR